MTGGLVLENEAQPPAIASLHLNGQLVWTNDVNTNAFYRLEWASQLGGPWHSFTYQPINTIDAHSSTSFRVEVPMFYRVKMETNPPPAGMVWIDAGDIELGQIGIAEPVHTNFISGFWMDEMEVTKAKWDEVYAWATNNGYTFDNAGSGETNNHPVHTVNWYDCVKWCNARSQMEGLAPCYFASDDSIYTNGQLTMFNDWVNWNADGYRLPTEAEWEKAARGGRQQRLFPWGGDTISHSQANYENSSHTTPAGSFPANGYGLHDMAGNVCEWCWDAYDDYSESYQTDPRGPPVGVTRVLRGGAWTLDSNYSMCAYRTFNGPNFAYDYFGFRCVRRLYP